MSGRVFPLQEICLRDVSGLCKASYWVTNYPIGYNPFQLMPSFIIDDLILRVIQLSRLFPLESSDLKLLIESGQTRKFPLEDLAVPAQNLQEILLDLSSSCRKLETIIIRNVSVHIGHQTNFYMVKYALNTLLGAAHSLKYVESCLEFSLEVLSSALHLESLNVNFPIKDGHIFDFLEVDGQLMPNSTLKHLEVFEDPRRPIPYIDIAVILRYCTELISFNCDISKSLEYLHAEELYNGSVAAKYKIQKCCLGDVSSKDNIATSDSVYITALTCPDVNDICMIANDHHAIYALSEFRKLSSLLIQWDKMEFCDFSSGMQLILQKEEFGSKLISLYLVNFTNVDFSCIAHCCPNLEELRVEYDYEVNHTNFPPSSFKKLQHLSLENVEDQGCLEVTLVGILSNACDLNYLQILSGSNLTDSLLKDILRKNSLSKVKHFEVTASPITVDGIRCLVSSLTSLEFFRLSGTSLDIVHIASVIHEINPRVIVSSSQD